MLRKQGDRLAVISVTLSNMEHDIMADLSALKASVADLTVRVKNATTVEAGVTTLIQAVVQQNKDLAAQIAAFAPETITQADLDGIKDQVASSAQALDDATSALAKAAAANTPTPPPASNLGPVGSDAQGQPRVDQKPMPLAGTGQPNPANPVPLPSVDPNAKMPDPNPTILNG